MNEPTAKRCPKCGETKPLDKFGRNRSTRDGLADYCKECFREIARSRRAADPEASREASRRWYTANRESALNADRRYRETNPEAVQETQRRYRQANAEAVRARQQRWYEDTRAAVFDHYGHACACCASTEDLTIDHVNGDGAEHREQIGNGATRLYPWLVANGFPPGFQVLCRQCNTSKGGSVRCRIDHGVTSTGPAEPASVSLNTHECRGTAAA